MLNLSASQMAEMVRNRKVSSVELVTTHLKQIEKINPALNAAVQILSATALQEAKAADDQLARGAECGPLHGVPVSIKDSLNIAGTICTAGTLGRKSCPPASEDATAVRRLRLAGAIPIAKTNLPDLLFAFESDNLIYGRTNNPYDLTRTSGGSSGGESALIAACGSPLGLGSDCLGSVRLPAHFCGISGIKPTSGRIPRIGHVPPMGGWIERLWQIGPMARRVEDLILAMHVLSGEDGMDWTAPPVPLTESKADALRVVFFTYNGIAKCLPEIEEAVVRCAKFLSNQGMTVEEAKPAVMDQVYELELALLGADGADGIDQYLKDCGSTQVHPLTTGFLNYLRPFRATISQFAGRWAQWDECHASIRAFFKRYDAILCPVYTQPALRHGTSTDRKNFEGFSYTMAWNVAGTPAATVRCSDIDGLPVNVQVVAKPWNELLALGICQMLETGFGGWQRPTVKL